MNQTATLLLDEAKRELTLKPRCGTCRIYPGHGQLCEERGRPVYTVSRRCRVYDPMSPAEFAELKEQQRVLELLRTVDPELYAQLQKEAQR